MYFNLGRKTKTLWQIRAGVLFLLLSCAFLFFLRYSPYYFIPLSVFAVIGVLAVFWYLPKFFSKYSIFVGENSVVVTRGVFIETSHIFPLKRLVFAGGYSSPVARMLGLKGITLRAARANVFIPEIDEKYADELIFGVCGEKND